MQSFARVWRLWAADRDEGRRALLGLTVLFVTVIVLADWRIQPNISLGFLYIFRILIAAAQSGRRETVSPAATCAGLRETFGPFSWDADAVPRMAMVSTAFAGAGLFVSELKRNRQLALPRLEAEESLRVLLDTSPAAILTADAEGKVLLANEAAPDCSASPIARCAVSRYRPLPARPGQRLAI